MQDTGGSQSIELKKLSITSFDRLLIFIKKSFYKGRVAMKTLKTVFICGSIFGLMVLFFILEQLGTQTWSNGFLHFKEFLGFRDSILLGENKVWLVSVLGVISATLMGWLFAHHVRFTHQGSINRVPSIVYFLPHFLYLVRALLSWNLSCWLDPSDRIDFLVPPEGLYVVLTTWLKHIHYYVACLLTSLMFFSKKYSTPRGVRGKIKS